jgi:hypothetical protein
VDFANKAFELLDHTAGACRTGVDELVHGMASARRSQDSIPGAIPSILPRWCGLLRRLPRSMPGRDNPNTWQGEEALVEAILGMIGGYSGSHQRCHTDRRVAGGSVGCGPCRVCAHGAFSHRMSSATGRPCTTH